MSILEVNQVYKYFGGVKANEDISLSVEQGSIVGLIGPNGSGKTILFNSIVGTHPIDKGSIKFDGKEVSELPVPVVAKLGLLRRMASPGLPSCSLIKSKKISIGSN